MATSPLRSPAPSRPTNTGIILNLLGADGTPISELTHRTGLTRRQVKYALDHLLREGLITITGGQGNRFTTYARS